MLVASAVRSLAFGLACLVILELPLLTAVSLALAYFRERERL